MRYCVLACLLALQPGWPASIFADEPSPDERAIRDNAQKYVEAFNRGDGAALAALWAPEAVYVDGSTGERLQGRKAIEEYFQQRFAGEDRPQLSVTVGSVRFITPDVAVEEGEATITPPGGEPVATSYSATSVRKEGVWLLDNVREMELPPAPTANDHLQPLAFLVGTWVNEDDAASVLSQYDWSGNGVFLRQTFSVKVEDRIDLRGTQVIGWDPAEQRIRSWMFDSDGGFGEGSWEWNGNAWVIHTTSTLPDGRKASAINVLTPVDVDTVTWKSSARQAGGEMLPNVDEFVVVRIPSETTTAAAGPQE